MNLAFNLKDGKLLLNKCGGDKLVVFTPSLNEDEEPCCCGKCPCGSNNSLSGPQLSVTGLLFGGNIVQSWSNIPFDTGANGGCGQDQLSVGSYTAAEINAALAGARGCSFDGIAVKAGAVACFFADTEQEALLAIMIGPVIVNHIIFQTSSVTAGVVPASGYTTHWANLVFADQARHLEVCAHNGNFSPNAPIVYKP